MMTIHLENVGKKFSHQWLLRNIQYTFHGGQSYAITGPNGSGKSTFIQLIAGNQLVSEGKVTYQHQGKVLEAEDVYRELSISAPYLELIEEFTLLESIDFHFRFKQLRSGVSIENLPEIGLFREDEKKYVRNFSSGMKQRLKLLLAFYAETPLLLLDEPTTNLDAQGIRWYHDQVSKLKDTIILVASNQPHEYEFCEEHLSLESFKP